MQTPLSITRTWQNARLTSLWGAIFGLATSIALLCIPAGIAAAPAQTTAGENPTYDERLKSANDAYNNSNYEQALTRYTNAAQLKPTDPFPYLGIARSYFWMDRYSAAVFYYDLFFTAANQRSEARDRVANQLDAARSERKLAASRSDGAAWQRPEAQRRLATAVRDQLDDGAAYTAGGGGAWALYKALLRTKYADPDLARLQSRLARKLVEEVDARMRVEQGALVPRRSLEDWQEDQQRLQAAAELAESDSIQSRIKTRRQVVSAGIAMLNGNHADAAAQFGEAMTALEDWQFLRWLRIACLIRSGDYERASEAIKTARKQPFITSRIEQYLDVMEALIAQRQDRDDLAADRFYELLGGRSDK